MRSAVWNTLGGLCLGSLLTGCVSVQSITPTTAARSTEKSYVAGQFTRVKSNHFAFVLKNESTGAEVVMPMGQGSWRRSDIENDVVMVEVPPGRYKVTEWINYSPIGHEVIKRAPVSNPYLTKAFNASPGAVMFLGKYHAETTSTQSYPRVYVYMEIKPQALTMLEARAAFRKTYEPFSEAPFNCMLCSDSLNQIPVSP